MACTEPPHIPVTTVAVVEPPATNTHRVQTAHTPTTPPRSCPTWRRQQPDLTPLPSWRAGAGGAALPAASPETTGTYNRASSHAPPPNNQHTHAGQHTGRPCFILSVCLVCPAVSVCVRGGQRKPAGSAKQRQGQHWLVVVGAGCLALVQRLLAGGGGGSAGGRPAAWRGCLEAELGCSPARAPPPPTPKFRVPPIYMCQLCGRPSTNARAHAQSAHSK